MAFDIAPLSKDLPFGVVVSGLTREDLDSAEAVGRLRDAWIQKGLVVFREVDVTPEFQIQLSNCFGPLEAHPVRELWVDGNSDLISLASRPESGNIFTLNGKTVASWIPWHSDLTYVPKINRGGILRVVQKTSWGGQTCFIDQIEAYNSLPTRLKEKVEGLEIQYQMNVLTELRYAKRLNVGMVRMSDTMRRMSERISTDFPPVAHPAVYVQKETGRRVLNISPMFAEGVVGMDPQEGGALLDELVDHIANCPAYQHDWQDGEMLLWDNWRMLHAVTGAPTDEVRIMRRTTIGGDYGLGRELPFQMAI